MGQVRKQSPRQPVAHSPLTELFRHNLRRVMQHDRDLKTQKKLEAAGGLTQASIGRILRGEQSPTLDAVHRLAKAVELEPWQLLIADLEPDNPPITKQIDEQQQELLRRFRTAAQELARYETDRPKHKPGDGSR